MSVFEYRKSSYSHEDGECVEVAANVPSLIAVRDSKAPVGPSLCLAPSAWTSFQGAVRDGLLTRKEL
ncbi:DUF397 domain-containing protein [Streptomyces acidiscabies]|uniref:DUF397 domain-containing protein n=1 Tax=Streptomyces acidiscabies TaxID=42234 RepID=A0AAP6B6W2_9ACTN|nr:DUF397 domain-containing protein [Streptomyces acidiscabies]MBP5939762.1 DUF397 domain-containing protein [Streptomyces sp. LBUM 1476]MDX2959277.1 DUF397 domain-containing protein [Streptomyces acidiscabies]MDX3017579.1 DUF397 domain-containing protein [Streptomyces acidiscabies]MDX3788054.1 DUF397 domain-containing protein [Streptomyces acidiscabies]GAV40569.1 hypothetical protein Saa2_03463 [Streptomyces acidiscabies]